MRFAKLFIGGVALVAVLSFATISRGAIESRDILKTYFETGDVPTQDQFYSLIDSMVNIVEDRYLIGLREYDPGSAYLAGDIKRFGIGDTSPVGPLGYVLPGSSSGIHMAPGFAGYSGFAAMCFTDASGSNLYYGYLQLSMDAATPGAFDAPGPGIHVDYVVWETDANTPITMAEVPEPATAGVLLASATFAMFRRRSRA